MTRDDSTQNSLYTFSKTNFTKMYGTDASFVNLESFNQIAKDINSRLLESYEKI